MRIGRLRMTRTQVAAGCLVVLSSFVGGFASAHWVNNSMSQATVAMRWETSVTALQQASQPMAREVAAATPKRTCLTLDGKSFEWDFANAPLAVQSCTQ
jgi:hypothetical protein